MPIEKTEFQSGRPHSQIEEDITRFLNERRENAFTSKEIMAGVHFDTNFSTLETARISTFAVADFATILSEMVRQGKVKVKIVAGQMYFATTIAAGDGNGARCPKCDIKVAEPKKTWMMVGRPDKKGQRLQLHIGLFECPTHGAFRTTLDKRKI